MKTKTKETTPDTNLERISISIPKGDLWKFFERQSNLPQYGSRSGYVRWLIVDAMRRAKTRTA